MQLPVKATWYSAIRLKENNCPYTIIHEFAHLCGNIHHDIGFRRDVIKLASVFLGKEFGNILKKNFKDAKLKITINFTYHVARTVDCISDANGKK